MPSLASVNVADVVADVDGPAAAAAAATDVLVRPSILQPDFGRRLEPAAIAAPGPIRGQLSSARVNTECFQA